MAFETKVILKMLANQIAMAESLEQAYSFVADAANVEGLDLPSYDEVKKKFSDIANQNKKDS